MHAQEGDVLLQDNYPEMFPHRIRFNNFLRVGRWNPEKTPAKNAVEILRQLSPKKGETMTSRHSSEQKY